MCVSARRDYAGGGSAVAAARDFGNAAVMAALQPAGWEVGDDVAIVLSELVTEAFEAGATALSVHVTVHYDRIDITLERRKGTSTLEDTTVEESVLRGAVLRALTSEVTRGADGDPGLVRVRLPCDPSFTARVRCRFRNEAPE